MERRRHLPPPTEFNDKIGVRLVPKGDPDAAVLRDLVAAFAEAQKNLAAPPRPKAKWRKPEPYEAAERDEATEIALDRIERKAAASEDRAKALQASLAAGGPAANAEAIAKAEAKIADVVRWLHERGLRFRIRVDEELGPPG